MAKGIGGFFISLSASAARFQGDMSKARKAAKKTGSGFKSSFGSARKSSLMLSKSLTTLTGAIVAVAGPAVLGKLISQSIDAADKLAKTADAANVSTDSLQELQHAANLSGVSQESLNSALKAFSKRVGEARSGTGTLITLLNKQDKALLDNIKSAKNTEEAFDLIVTAAANMSNQLDRNALLAAAFGRSAGVEMANMLKNGTAGLEEMRQEARDLGLVIDESLLRNAEEAKDAMTRLSSVVKTNITAAFLAAGPVIEKVSEDLIPIVKSISELAIEGERASKRTQLLAAALLMAGDDADEFGEKLKKAVKVMDYKHQIAKLRQDVLKGAKAIEMLEPGSGFGEEFQNYARNIKESENALTNLTRAWIDIEARLKSLGVTTQEAADSQEELEKASTEAAGNISESYKELTNDQKTLAREYWSWYNGELLSQTEIEKKENDKKLENYKNYVQRMKEIDEDLKITRAIDNKNWIKTDYDLAGERIAAYRQYTNAVGDLSNNILSAQNANVDRQTRIEIANATKSYNAQKALIERRYKINGELSEAGIEKMNQLEEGHAAHVENLETRGMQMKERNARKLKGIRIAQAIANTASAVIEAYPNLLLASIIAASGLAQIATIRAQPYAKGGIVGDPTFFTNRGQPSIMGEAGLEAIMPLSRTSGGDLGVKVEMPAETVKNVMNMSITFSGPISDKDYINRTVVPIITDSARKGYNKLMVKR